MLLSGRPGLLLRSDRSHLSVPVFRLSRYAPAVSQNQKSHYFHLRCLSPVRLHPDFRLSLNRPAVWPLLLPLHLLRLYRSAPSGRLDPLHLSNPLVRSVLLDLSDPLDRSDQLDLSDPLGLRRVPWDPWDRSGRPAPSAPFFPSVLSVRMAADSPGSSMTAPGSQIYALPVLFFL